MFPNYPIATRQPPVNPTPIFVNVSPYFLTREPPKSSLHLGDFQMLGQGQPSCSSNLVWCSFGRLTQRRQMITIRNSGSSPNWSSRGSDVSRCDSAVLGVALANVRSGPSHRPHCRRIFSTTSRWLRSMNHTTFILDPLQCPECGGEIKVAWLIEPAQAGVIEAIGFYNCCASRAAGPGTATVEHRPQCLTRIKKLSF